MSDPLDYENRFEEQFNPDDPAMNPPPTDQRPLSERVMQDVFALGRVKAEEGGHDHGLITIMSNMLEAIADQIAALEAENKRLRNALLDIYEESQPPAYWHEVAKAALAPPDGLGGYIDNTPEEACICERFPAQRGWVASIRHNVLCPVHKRLPADTEEV